MDVSKIESRIKTLVDRYQALDKDHRALRAELSALKETCAQLQAKRDLAVANVEAVIKKIKQLEGAS
jgi:uncharacterized protein (TIGR02449 family)